MRDCERVTTQPQTGTVGQISIPHLSPAMQSSCVSRGEDTSFCLSVQDVPKLSSSLQSSKRIPLVVDTWIDTGSELHRTYIHTSRYTQTWESLDMMAGLRSRHDLFKRQNYSFIKCHHWGTSGQVYRRFFSIIFLKLHVNLQLSELKRKMRIYLLEFEVKEKGRLPEKKARYFYFKKIWMCKTLNGLIFSYLRIWS